MQGTVSDGPYWTTTELTKESNGKDLRQLQDSGAAESGAVAAFPTVQDPDLQAIIIAWPSLPLPVRAGIVAMVRASNTEE